MSAVSPELTRHLKIDSVFISSKSEYKKYSPTVRIMEADMSVKPMKRVYYFTPPDHSLDNLRKRHLKVSRFSQCNDPYELAAFSQKNQKIRRQSKDWLRSMDASTGLLCFCRSWRNPVMWGHYARNHTGLCYGFDVDPETFIDVRYVSERLYPDLTPENFFSHVGEDQMEDLFATKFIHWNYEEEVRHLILFSENVSNSDLVFHGFSEKMQLKEVIVGAKSDVKIADVEAALTDKTVEVLKARLAFKRFEVVRQMRRSLG